MEANTVEFVYEGSVREQVLAVFHAVGAVIERLLPGAAVEHVGSTAVPGALTKGDLDVCVLVEPSAFGEADRALARRFARNVGSDQTASLSSFVDDSWSVPVGVQLVARGGPEDFFVRWRDLLRGSSSLLDEYNDLKRRWRGRSPVDYRAAKARFIEEALSPR